MENQNNNNQTNELNNIDGNDLHYRFTAYVIKALDNARIRYLKKESQDRLQLVSLEEMIEAGEELSSSVDFDTAAFSRVEDITELIENDALCLAILELTAKERQILSLHIIYKVPFTEIAEAMNMNYKTVYSKYANAIKKIEKKLGNENGRF